MNNFLERISNLSPKRLALLAMELQTKLEAAERQKSDPIAVIGMSCRFPGGANSPESFWQLLSEGQDVITEIPASRWQVDDYYDPNPDAPGKMATRWGGFIDDFDRFDPQFFGISPREARSMDPQQRLVLEVGWEALERAGYAPDKLTGSKTGVFIGACNSDYYHLMTAGGGDQLDTYTATGSAHSVISGRLSYVLGLQGPSLSVDTACSSSLVAVHLAVQSLRQGECQMALAGGVNILAAVEVTIALSKGNMMASDGRCKAFDAAADGFVRSEGCGLIVLKRLSQAVADGDNILAVIRGSAINQDGRSNGLTAPNGPSQETVIQEALVNAGLEPHQVSYVETHGTGTSLGDPIEAQALGAVLGRGRTTPLAIGSVKTNIGHLEAAAGVAGLMKLILTLQHREIPPHLHLQTLNPYISWAELPLVIPTQRTPWQVEQGQRIGGVSSFGFSGTNAHVIVEEAPIRPPVKLETDRPLHLLTLSAKSEASLEILAKQFEQHLETQPAASLADISFTANGGRAHFNHRLTVVAAEVNEVHQILAAWNKGQQPDGLMHGHVQGSRPPEVVFLFTGQGAQYVGMGRKLYETQPTFRKMLDKCDELLRPYLEHPLLSVIYPEPDQPSLLDQTAYTQPALFAIEYALAELWRSWGVEPAVVMGHSVGEYVAACIAGVFSLEDGLKLVAERGRLMQAISQGQQGEMAAVFADEVRVAAAVKPYAERVSISGINGPEHVVISGEKTAIQAVLDTLKTQGIRGRRLAVSIAGHSPLMDPILNQFEQVAAEITFATPKIGIISGVTGQLITGREIATPAYWRRHVREAVQFLAAVQTAHAQGYRLFVEIGPTPTLLEMGQRCLPKEVGLWLPSLRPKYDDWQQLLTSLGELYVQGIAIDWAGFERDYVRGRRRLQLPVSPFEQERYWFNAARPGQHKPVPQGHSEARHPLLGRPLKSPALTDTIFETQLSAAWPSFLDHHRVYGLAILPSPAFIEMVLTAAQASMGPGSYAVTDFNIQEAFVLPEEEFKTGQLILKATGQGQADFQIVSLEDKSNWKVHVTGKIQRLTDEAPAAASEFDVAAVQARCQEEISGDVYYQKLRGLGLEFGTAFRGLTQVWRREGEALGLVRLPETLLAEANDYQIHPAFLDACFHLLGAPLADEIETAYLLIGIERFQLYRTPGTQLWNHTILQTTNQANKELFSGHIRLFDQAGQLVAEIEGLHLKRAGREAMLHATRRQASDWLYQVQWQVQPQVNLPPDYLPAPQQLTQQVTPAIAALSSQHNLAAYRELSPDLDALCAAYIVQAWQQLGWSGQPGESVSTETLAAQLGVISAHHRLLGRMAEILSEESILSKSGSGWQVVQKTALTDTESLLARLIAQYPAHEAELRLTGRCGMHLAQVLAGTQDPLQLLFPAGSLEATERLYQDSPFAQVYNTLIQQTLAAILEQLPPGRTIRLLEIGAGTGATTSYILPKLPANRTEYLFTDLSPLFTGRAAEKFKDYPFVQYQLLNIEQDPAEQGLADRQFDLILAANVLHATNDLRQTLSHVKQLLAPHGLLILLEGAKPQRWVDLTFGLTEGWWKFTDTETRQNYPLLSPVQWSNLLHQIGFEGASSIHTSQTGGQDLPEQAIILAQAPQTVTLPEQQASWLIFADSQGVSQELTKLLERRGDRCLLVKPGQTYAAGADGWQVDVARPEDFRRLLHETLAENQPACRGIIHLWSLDSAAPTTNEPSAIEAEALLNCGSVLHLVQALTDSKETVRAPLWLVTKAAQVVNGDGSTPAVNQTPLWGLGRVIALEHPEGWGGLIDLDPQADLSQNAQSLLSEICQPDGEDQIAWRHEQRYVARLMRTPQLKMQPILWRSDGAYLITGGLGGLGLEVARWMAEQGARYLILMGRRGLPERKAWATLPADSNLARQVAAIEAIEALGATVVIEAADVSDQGRMEALFKQFGQTMPPLRGIIHAAAALSDWSLQEMPFAALADMLKPKLTGTWLLHQLSQEIELDFFGLFSSTTALLGSARLAHYAAANQFLDGFAHYRHALGLPATSINWGTWEQMRIASAQEQQRVAQFGLNRMPAEQALTYLGNLLGISVPQVAVAAVDWTLLKPAYEAKRQRPFLQHLGGQPAEERRNGAVREQASAKQSDLLRQWTAAGPDQRPQILINHLRLEVAKVLGINSGQAIDIQRGLFEMGLDSLMSVELKSRLEACVEKSLPSTLIFNYPSIADLADYLTSNVLNPTPAESNVKPAPSLDKVEQSAVLENEANSAEVDDLSEDELAALLLSKLEQLQ